MSETLRYPIGRFAPPASGDYADRGDWIRTIAALPGELEQAVIDLSSEQLAVELGRAVAPYAWHGRHHLAQVASLREREGW